MDLALIGEVITTVALVGLAAVVYVQETRIQAVERATGLKLGTMFSATQARQAESTAKPRREPESSSAGDWKGRRAAERPAGHAAASPL